MIKVSVFVNTNSMSRRYRTGRRRTAMRWPINEGQFDSGNTGCKIFLKYDEPLETKIILKNKFKKGSFP